ncbi:MAG: amino acid adenylation domain-containing protein [Acidobacteriota bacterium]
MSILDVLQDCQRSGIKLTVQQGKLLADDVDGRLTAELRARLAEHKAEIITWLAERTFADSGPSAQPVRSSYPLSFAQQHLWLTDQVQGGSSDYGVPAAFELTGVLNRSAMQNALDLIVERHSVLRTVFRLENGEPVQVILPPGAVPVAYVDLETMDAEEQQTVLQQMIRDESARAFDLSSDLMLRCTLIGLAQERHVVLFTMHHIACDGGSLSVLVREFVAAYDAGCNGRRPVLPELPIQYCDYAIWQRESAQGGLLAADVAYWQKRLAGIPVVHSLPLDKSRPAVQRFEAERHQQRIGRSLLKELLQLGTAHRASLFMVLQSAFALLLSRFSGEADVVMGVPNGGRPQQVLEPLIGYFINTQVLRTEVDERQTVSDLLNQVRRNALDAFAHNNVPFDHLVDVLKHPRNLAHNPLCQVKFVLQNYETGELQLTGLQLKSMGRAEERVHFDLDLTIVETPDELRLIWGYKSGLFQPGTIARMAETYHRLLEEMVADPDEKLETLSGLDEKAIHALREAGTGRVVAASRDELLPRAIARQAAQTPGAEALRCGDLALSYRELESRSNRLAQLLVEQGIARGSRVGVHLSRSVELLIAQLAVMKTGAAYVPLDPMQQSERLAFMIRDAGIAVVLLDSRTMRLPVLGIDTVFVDGAATEDYWLSDYPDAAPAVDLRPDDTIYVLYTSGSTGAPKGVEVHHGGVIDYCAFARDNYYGGRLQGSLVATSPAFDLTLPALYVPLLRGGCVELLPELDELDALSRWLANDSAAVLLRLTPSHVQALLTLSDAAPRQAAHVFVIGGEVFEPSLARGLQDRFPNSRLYNHYGPTETVVGCAWFDVSESLDALGVRTPIGRPMENTTLYVLDAQGRMQPPGAPGELYIGGAGVAKGYLNDPELTAEKFVANPFGEGRLYRSGDQVRWRPDGQMNGPLEFLGRVDRQVKLRGFRIELGEIESRLEQSEHVRDAVVRLWGEGDAAQLVAYLMATDNEGATQEKRQDDVHAQLSSQLPSYMLPAAYVWLDVLPLTVNGKMDVQALPAPATSAVRTREYEAPQGDLEETMAELWQALLRVERVGRHDNFFELGGHSLLAVQLVSRLRATLNVELPLRTLFATPTLSALAAAVRTAGASTMGRILPADRSQPLPLSLAQQRIWFLDQLDKAASAAYHMGAALRLLGRLDRDALQATLDRLVARHESLRTRFVAVDGVPYQQIAPADCGFMLRFEDLRALSGDEREATVAARTAEEARAPFDLSEGPLIRGQLLELAEDEHVLLVTQHHIVGDGWSLGILVREVATLYTAFGRGEADPISPLEVQYADYALWQRSWLQGEALTRQVDFWKNHLAGAPALLELPLDRPRPALESRAGGTVPVMMPASLTADLRAFSQRHGVTLFMTLLSAWGLLLSRLSGQTDVVIGTPVANRQRREIENLIGCFVNTLALRLCLAELSTEQLTVASLLAQVKETTLAAFAHQELPFEQVVEAVQPVRSLSHSPLFQTMLALNNTNTSGERPLQLPGLTLTRLANEQNSTQFDLSLVFAEQGERLDAALDYASTLFDRATVERWAAYYVRVLEGMVSDASVAADALPILSDADRRQVVVELNDTQAEYPQDTLIHELFEQQAALRPDAVAVLFEDQSLTYSELDARANQLAHELIALGVRPDDRVAICAERSLEMVVGLLGILKAGGAYLPMDPAYPTERLQYLIEDGAPKVLLTQRALLGRLPVAAMPTLFLDSDELSARLLHPTSTPSPRQLGLTTHHLAYVIYTSGSTGTPKGVMVEHGSVLNMLTAHAGMCGLTARDRVLQSASFGFDSSVAEIFPAWSVGATVVLRQAEFDPDHFGSFLNRHRISVVDLPMAVWQQWSHSLSSGAEAAPESLRLVIVSGETLLSRDAREWFSHPSGSRIALLNNYGPTEATVNATAYFVEPSRLRDGQPIPIGRPIANTQLYILDRRGEPVPAGVEGEIHIGGAGVARGYLNRPQWTAERFLCDPFSADPNARIYRTGDLGRWLADGNLEFRGRNDFQVKLRGFRIELGEIEAVLNACAGVREAVVIAREDVPGDKRLVAYLVADAGVPLQAAELRTALSMRLPEYMLPSAFVALVAMPLTANGKLDRKALPAPDATSLVVREYEAPQGEIETALAAIWQDLLEVPQVGRQDHFFELGGHSLLAVQLVSRIRTALGVELPLRAVFAGPSLSALAGAVGVAGSSTLGRIQRADRTQALPLSLAQQRLWFIDQLDRAASAAYHMSAALRLFGKLDIAALRATLDRLMARHESLRTSFGVVDGAPHQQFAPEDCGFALTRRDLRDLDEDSRARAETELTAEEARAPFDLSTGPLIRGQLITLAEDEYLLLITQHHIVSDGWSIDVMTREVAALYAAFARGGPDPLPPLEIQYADYAQWQREWLQGDELTRQSEFWTRHLAGAPALLELPTDRVRPAVQSYAGDSVSLVLPEELTGNLRAFSQRHGVTLFMTLLSGWGLLLSRLSGRTDVVIGTPVANRQRREVENLIGFFVNTLALRLRFEEQPSVEALLAQVKESTVAAFAHQELPFEQVVEALQPQRSQSHSPLAQVTFTWDNLERGRTDDNRSHGDALTAADLVLAPVNRAHETTQVDLQLLLSDGGLAVTGRLVYATALFDRATIERWVAYYVRVLEAMVADASAAVDTLPLLSASERQQQLSAFNATEAAYPEGQLIHELFEQQVSTQPDAVAVLYEDESLTYAELNTRANQLAHHLLGLGVKPDDRVAICSERNADLIVGMLAILKAGGSYVPLDPSYPRERLAWMLEDCAPVALLIQSDVEALLPETELPVLRLDVDVPVLAHRMPARNPSVPGLHARNLAYVIYTSGSTGTPKGVMVDHRCVLSLVINNPYFEATPEDCFAHCANPAFDAATWEIWGSLLNGARLLVVPSSVVMDPAKLNATLYAGGVTALWLTVGLFNQYVDSLPDAFGQLRYLLVGGDALDPRTIRQLLSRAQRPEHVVNGYGPTETTTFACTHEIRAVADDARSIPLGRPIANTQVYILDTRGEPVPVGVEGEITIGGDGVARGYLNRPELTAERFLRDPFSVDVDARMYKTGDRGRWLADGTIEFLGRNDFQVKIRGFRVELGEIEARLSECAGVRDAVVLARPRDAQSPDVTPGDKRLVAYLVVDEGVELAVADLREALARQLPDSMVPSAFVQLDAFPLTVNGKLDRQALPAPEATALNVREYEAPEGEIEETLATLWQELLRVERVGRRDQFFELGGHSLLVVAMVERLRALGFSGEVRAVFASPILCDYAATLQCDAAANETEVPPNPLTPETTVITPDLLPLITLTQAEIDRIVAAVPGGVGNIQDIYPLLPMQEGMLFHHLLETEGDTYLLRDVIAFDDRELLDGFLAALKQLIARHDILRTAVSWEGLSTPVQVVFRDASLPIEVVSLSSEGDALEELRERTDPHRMRLDLRRAPLLAAYVTEDAQRGGWLMALLSHHMVCDHATMELLVTEVRALLRGERQQLSSPLPLRNLVAHAGRVAQTEHEAFFREQLADVEESTAPFGILDVQIRSMELRPAAVRIDTALATRIRECAGKLGVPPSVLFHVAWAQVLARCTGQSDVVFGTVLSGRLQGTAGADRALGMFINTLPLRVSLDGQAAQVIQQSYQRMVTLLAHEQAPLVLAQRCSGVPLPLPLFTTILNYRHSEAATESTTSEMEGIRLVSVHEAVNYPLSASVDDYGSSFSVTVESSRGVDPKRIAAYMVTAVTGLVDAVALPKEQTVAQIDILPPEESAALLHELNATRADYPKERLIHESFEQQAALQPDAPAVIFDDQSLSYGELNVRANQLAHELVALGVQPDDRVAICVERGLDMVVGMLAILKAGGAYLPLDPAYPVDLVHSMLQDGTPKALLTQEALRQRLSSVAVPALVLDRDELREMLSAQPAHNPDARARGLTARNLAYVIYTSGSTGAPKGVMVEHGSVLNMLTAHAGMCGLTPRDRVLQFASFGFDSSVAEIFPAWSAGATVVLRHADLDMDRFVSFLSQNRISVADLPTALWRQWSQYLSSGVAAVCESLRLVIVSGEALERSDAEQWFSHPSSNRIGLLNNYGPTEATVNATAYIVEPSRLSDGQPISIGRPIANSQIYLLDRRGVPVPAGVEGEIYIGGDGVARGYLNRPELTAERFPRDPFSADPNARMYKTGDLGRWRADGNLEFRGRNDFQVKIRGFRIELGEIEAKLREYAGAGEAVVIAREDVPGDKRLVAYLVANEGATLQVAELRAALSTQLPEYMVPSAFVALEAMPLTTNGKVDRRALPAPEATALSAREYDPPQGEIETILAAIWQDLLKLPRVGRRDHFFELGGHSLKAITLSVHVQEQLHVALPVKTIFANPRLLELAQSIAEAQQSLVSEQEVAAMQSELESLSDDELQAFVGGNTLG